ncbi:Proteasome stabiliser ECM29 [Penicillium robsamsonii]|uniref:Proteasome stabiliser ECM29 n=1 Tax=Penicillium robsamsonii TaxID=1792511 RepID=UPI002547ED20|nr:Proteasome stabiliser ECM29 [Penicillium robsamsonii]KAJ5834299.1 Proteasome stabiliser ECM29 [Penicillium robsamsonii]
MADSQSPEARELSLIGKVEFRIAMADTDAKLQSLLGTYLPPLLLKLGSDSVEVRNKIISVCQHVNTRIKAPSIQLPVAALLKQFKEQKSQLIRHFDLIYAQQGIDRLGSEARVEILLPLLQGISKIGTSPTQGAIVFNLVLRLLPLLKLPARGSEEDKALKARLGLSDEDSQFLSFWLAKLLLLTPGPKETTTCPGLSPDEYSFLNKGAPANETWNPSTDGGLNLTETKVTALRFIGSGAFKDPQRFLPSLIASADANSRLADLGDETLKRFTADIENPDVVQELYDLYFGTVSPNAPNGAPPARSPLQVKILVFLGKSIKATADPQRILRLIEDGLLSDSARSSQGLQAAKLRTQIFTFTTWVVRMGAPSDLKQIAPILIAGLRDFIQSQGWPSPAASGQKLPTTDLSLRGLAYESIGIMVPKVDFMSQADAVENFEFDLVRWLFSSLSADDSSPQIFVSIDQALGSILNSSLDSHDKTFQGQLRPFLVRQMSMQPGDMDPDTGYRAVRGVQYAAVRFANRFLPFGDVVARWIDLMAIARGPERQQEIVEEGKKGLHPYWYRLLNPAKDGKWSASSAAPVHDESWFDFPKFEEATRFLLGSGGQAEHLNVQSLSASQLLSDPYKGSFMPAIPFLRNTLLWEAFSASGVAAALEQDWDYKLEVLLSTSVEARSAVRKYIRESAKESVLAFLSGTLEGLVTGEREGLRQCGVHFVEICSLAPNDVVQELLPRATSLIEPICSNNQDNQGITARAFGILVSHPAFSEEQLKSFITQLAATIQSWNTSIGQEVMRVRGAILALAYLLSRLAYRGLLDRAPEAQTKQFIETLFDILDVSRDTLLQRTAQEAIGQLSLSGVLSLDIITEDGWKKILGKLSRDAKTENQIPISSLGLLTMTFSRSGSDSTLFTDFLSSLYSLHEIRSPEVQFTVGEALSNVAVGWDSRALIQDFDIDAEFPRSDVPRTVFTVICDKVIADCIAPKPSLRKASAIWLLSLVKNCGHMKEMQERLRKCQATFSSLLGNRDEVVQETGAHGLSLVYEIGDQSLKDDLVQDLVESFTSTGPNLGGGKIEADTQLFEPGALPTGEGSSVNTYKDIMNLAAEAGDPTLVYRFMSLASNNAIWTNRAAFGRFGISSIFSDSSVDGYLAKNPKIYPKLFRYRFDPNPNVQRSMNTIWQALVKDPTVVIDTHFDDIMQDLLKSVLAGREWRVRQASCAAVADLIQGRRPEKYAQYLDEIYSKAFKLLDDIKESVRTAALKLCQTITNSVIRTLETSGTEKRAETLLKSAIPFLLSDKGLDSSVEEVQGYAIGALISMIKKSPGSLLRPHVPNMLEKFLSALSSLEPQAVNYVHLNADKYGLTGQEIDKMRLSSIRTSPMMEVIERYLIDNLDESNLDELAQRLEDVLRSAVGLPSKVGCSRVLVLLSMKTLLFRPYADRFIQMLTKYVVDRNDTVSASYCSSMGYLLRLASDDRVVKTFDYAKNLYLTAEDATPRVISGEILYSASKLSNDRFMAFAASALPFVFVCKHDGDEHVKEQFEKIWQDNVGGSRAVSLYIREIVGLVSDNLESPRWAIKHTAARAIAQAVLSLDAEIDLPTAQLIWPVLERALAGKTWEGKEVVLKALVKFSGQAQKLWQSNEELGKLKTITVREAKRANVLYRPHGLRAMGEIAQARKDLNFMPDALKIIPVIEEMKDQDQDQMEIDSRNGRGSTQDDTLAACVQCFLQCFNPTASGEALGKYVDQVTSPLAQALQLGGRLVVSTVYDELRAFFTRVDQWIDSSSGEQIAAPLTVLADKLLTGEVEGSVEAIRKGRAETILAYLKLSPHAQAGVPDTLIMRVREWRASERSGSVQRLLDEALALPN